MINLTVLYPQPTDVDQFESDYTDHLNLFHEKTGLPNDAKPYTVTRFVSGPEGQPDYYLMFSLPFDSAEALESAMSSSGMQDMAADANRISSGGAPTVLIGHSK